MITPPELMPYANKDIDYTYIVDENITSDDWVLIDDTPVEKVIPAMRKYYEYVDMDDFEPAAGVWYRDKTGKRPTNGKELLELFFEEEIATPHSTEQENNPPGM